MAVRPGPEANRLGLRNMSVDTMVRTLLAEEHGTAGSALRDLIESLAGVALAWDVHESQETVRPIK